METIPINPIKTCFTVCGPQVVHFIYAYRKIVVAKRVIAEFMWANVHWINQVGTPHYI